MRKDMEIIFNHFKILNEKLNLNRGILQMLEGGRHKIANYAAINGKVHQADPSFSIKKVLINNIPCEWICDTGADKNKRLLYIHGGGFFGGSLDTHRGLSCMFSRLAGVSVLAVDYRLAPDHPFPAGLDDCYEAYRWLLENSPEGPEKAANIFVAGDSAGGNLAISLLLRLKKEKMPMPNAALPISPVFDFSAKSKSVFAMDGIDPVINRKALRGLPLIYLFGRDLLAIEKSKLKIPAAFLKILIKKRKLIRNPLVSPLYADLSGLPPVLINVGELEILRDDAVRFVEKAREQGVKASVKVWADMIHVFIAFWGHIPEAEQCCLEMAEFIKEHSEQTVFK